MNYAEFRDSLAGKIEEKLEWKNLATFVPNKRLPVYRWFYYKEGFAKDMVDKIIEMFEIKKNGMVLDPFCGSGTTLLACKQRSINSVGYDVLPVSVFASKVKTSDYDVERLLSDLKKITKTSFVRFEIKEKFPSLFYKAFSKYALEDIAFIRKKILDVEPENRGFFVLALINSSLKCSFARKDGSAIKIRRCPVAPLRKMFGRVAANMIKDVKKCGKNSADVVAELNDSRSIPLEDGSVDAVITSPPYLNQIDYTKVYSIEDFFLHGEPVPGIRAYIGLRPAESIFLDEIDLPVQARLYFEDMDSVLKEMHRVLKNGGRTAIIVGNGYAGKVIESDIILAYLAEKIGFFVEKIYVLNKRFALEERTIKKGVLMESLIILSKQ